MRLTGPVRGFAPYTPLLSCSCSNFRDASPRLSELWPLARDFFIPQMGQCRSDIFAAANLPFDHAHTLGGRNLRRKPIYFDTHYRLPRWMPRIRRRIEWHILPNWEALPARPEEPGLSTPTQ
jgi:hypothetical protein